MISTGLSCNKVMATTEQLDSSIEVIMELNGSQQMQMDSSQELKVDVEESPEVAVCRLCANHKKGVDMLLKENSSVRHIAKQYLHLEFIDGLPTHICLSCCSLLTAWDAFMHVFSNSQQQFKQQMMGSGSQASTLSGSPSALTPSPPRMHTMPLPPRKRKMNLMPETSSLLSPSTSSTSSIQVSPESSGGGRQVARGSDTDEASECPQEVVQERLNLSMRPQRNQIKGRKKKVQPTVTHIKLEPRANHFQQRHCNVLPVQHNQLPLQQPFYGYPFQHQPARYMDPSTAAFYLPQQHQPPFRGMAPMHAPLLPPPNNFGLNQSPVFPGEAVLNSFLANIPPVLHQSFIHNFLQNLMVMHAVAEADKNLPPPNFEPRKGV